MGKKWDKFRLLMWKNILLQWRHPRQTIVEILAPVLFSSLLVVVRSLVDPETHSARYYTPFDNKIQVATNVTTLQKIVWCPSNPMLAGIMDSTVKAISSDGNIAMEHIPFANCHKMDGFLSNDLNLIFTLAGIQFNGSSPEDTELDKKIKIIFRFPGELRSSAAASIRGLAQYIWKTGMLFPVYQIAGPRGWDMNTGAEPSYYYEGFLKLQQELSFSIIKQLKQSFNRNDVQIQMQRFPYPKWTQDLLLFALQAFVGLIIMLSFVYTCISTVKIITTEKEKQLKEAMKIMGLPNWLHWSAWFFKTVILLLVTIILMVILMKARWYPGTDFTVFTESNPVVIFVFLLFFICATTTFCFAISVFFSKANTAAAVAGMVWFLSYFPFSFMQDKYDRLSLGQKLGLSLCSNSAMAYGFQLMLMFEGIGEGLQWHNIWKTTTPDDNLTLGHLMIMLTFDCLIYLLIALYVEAVFPGEYGVPLPWNFPFTRSYWYGQPAPAGAADLHGKSIANAFFEKEPKNLTPGIQIKHLRKVYANNKVAVRDLSMNMFKNQITVLLGHNGAGKTTTMSMLTGMISPTSGTAIVGGCDIRTDMNGVRESLGLCPQHNILFDELTVREHLYFYCKLKGVEKESIDAEIDKYIELLELIPKKNSKSSTLSGGMQRKLSVGVALCGGSKVVMCDEPTAGMDPAARRALWDLLQSQKKNRTILLSTHFMDEADLLGDRIAIMAGGELQCCGSSFFLKKKYGAGYHLIMEKSPGCIVRNVTSALQKHIPDIQVESNIGSELMYLLSEHQAPVFEEMLRDLESKTGTLGISSYGISLTTLEEVFMKVGADCGQEEQNNERDLGNVNKMLATNVDGVSIVSNNATPVLNNNVAKQFSQNRNRLASNQSTAIHLQGDDLLQGRALYRNQFLAMLMKKGLSIARSWLLLIIQNCIPILFLILAIAVVRGVQTYTDLPNLAMELNSYDHPVTTLTHDGSHKYLDKYIEHVENQGQKIMNWGSNNFSQKMYQLTESSVTAVRLRHIVGASFSGKGITIWFNNEPYHSPPLGLQLVMNAILQTEVSSDYHIQIYNYPLPFTINTKFMNLARGQNMGFQIAFNIGFSMAFVSSFYIMFYVRERVSKAKHLQFVSGVEVLPFWCSAFICDMVIFMFTSICIITTLLVFQEDGFSTFPQILRTMSVLMYFGFSMLPMMYLASYLFDIPATGYTRMTLINIFSGVAGFLIVQVLASPELKLEYVSDALHWILLLIPHYSLSTGIRDLHVLYASHKLCDTLIESCSQVEIPELPQLSMVQCRAQICRAQPKCCTMTRNYYDWEAPGIGRNVFFSCFVGCLLITILLLIEYRVFEQLLYRIRAKPLPTQDTSSNANEDDDVKREKDKIRNASPQEIKNYILAMCDVTKYYKNFLAVNDLCLGVKKSECFGLLGVNGAGKTTTFKMMTGDVKFSSGDAWVNGLSLKTDMKKIHQLIGYCPQFDALLDDITCRETLTIFSLLRGVRKRDCKLIGEKLARDFDFYRHLDKKVRELSGGNKRKLSTAITLIGEPLILYLDEPTTGMDPATKRHLWNALCKVRDNGKCIVLTSHSMEECEALCTRIAIMVNGRFTCLGSTQHLKNKFSEGYTLTIKIRKTSEANELVGSDMDPIEKFVKRNFPSAIIREKHQELITFYIPDKNSPWSKMFGVMERGKKSLNIEDYSLGQSSLEQVFLSFTKYQREAE